MRGVSRHWRTGVGLGVALVLGVVVASVLTPTHSSPRVVTVEVTRTLTTSSVGQRLDDLERRANEIGTEFDRILIPITILISILALGGALGIVFSIRDQRRVSQLHELTVNAEISNQRRTEQSYSSFLEASQKTLTLVNDTLELAKESSDRAAHTMELKTTSNLDTIEMRAEELVLEVIEHGDFEQLVDLPDNRTRLQSIAADLEALEGYMLLQDIEPRPYSRFVRGIEQYLHDDTSGALRTLRHTEQDSSKRQLQRIARYWVAKLNAALHRYEQAARMLDLTGDDPGASAVERLERERARAEIVFFQIASAADAPTAPADRLRKLVVLLTELEQIAAKIAEETRHDTDQHAGHEVDATRADLYAWVAHNPIDLYWPFKATVVDQARALIRTATAGSETDSSTVDTNGTEISRLIPAAELEALIPLLAEQSPAVTRAWAQLQAQAICAAYDPERALHLAEDVDFSLAFSRAEADFMLGCPGDVSEYRTLERRAIEERTSGHREQRHVVEVAEVFLVCKVRLLARLRENPGADNEAAETEVNSAYLRLQEAWIGVRDHNVTIFSHIQCRNVTRDELRAEASELLDQALHPKPSEDSRQRESGGS